MIFFEPRHKPHFTRHSGQWCCELDYESYRITSYAPTLAEAWRGMCEQLRNIRIRRAA